MPFRQLALAGLVLIACIASPSFALAKNFSTVVLDAGHGGHDRGGIPSNLMPEKGVTLDVARQVRDYLADAGLRVVMTRTSDTFVSLPARVAIANAQKRSIFVSIHFNSGTRRGANGIESFYCGPTSKPLAALLLRYVMKTTDAENRGVKKANFYVLRKTKSTSALIECGFLTNTHDVALASSTAYRTRLARQIANAILEYRRS